MKFKLIKTAKERFIGFFYLMKEGYRLKDKLVIFEYHLRFPKHIINYLRGIKNTRTLISDVYMKNNDVIFYCGDNFSTVYGVSNYSEREFRKRLVLDKGVFVDVGANCGIYSIPLAKKLKKKGKVIAIEVEKENIKNLKKNVKLNKLKNIHVVGKGCFSKKGEKWLNLADHGTGGHSFFKSEETQQQGKKQLVKIDTLDNILKDLKIDKVDLIKLDIEGAELETLKGARQTLINSKPKLLYEFHTQLERTDLECFLRICGYNYFERIDEYNILAEVKK